MESIFDTGHEKFRAMVCCMCFCERGKKASRTITEDLESKLKEHFPSYTSSDSAYATGLCETCRRVLTSQNTANPKKLVLLGNAVHQPVELKRMTRRQSEEVCSCEICSIGKMNGLEWRMKVKCSNDLKQYCPKCFSEIYRGSNHSAEACRLKSIEILSEKEKDIISIISLVYIY